VAENNLPQRARSILRRLKKVYPGATTALNWANPLELLIATILSAQCTDERVNQVTQSLFKKYRSARDYAQADLATFENEIRSTGFFRNKAKNIRAACEIIARDFGGQVPDTMEELLSLPGVARKTANCVLGTAFGKATGVVVDTHVERLAHRMGFSKEKDTNKIERDLMALFPKKDWVVLAHTLIRHGRAVCTARNPQCASCPVEDLCPKIM